MSSKYLTTLNQHNFALASLAPRFSKSRYELNSLRITKHATLVTNGILAISVSALPPRVSASQVRNLKYAGDFKPFAIPRDQAVAIAKNLKPTKLHPKAGLALIGQDTFEPAAQRATIVAPWTPMETIFSPDLCVGKLVPVEKYIFEEYNHGSTTGVYSIDELLDIFRFLRLFTGTSKYGRRIKLWLDREVYIPSKDVATNEYPLLRYTVKNKENQVLTAGLMPVAVDKLDDPL